MVQRTARAKPVEPATLRVNDLIHPRLAEALNEVRRIRGQTPWRVARRGCAAIAFGVAAAGSAANVLILGSLLVLGGQNAVMAAVAAALFLGFAALATFFGLLLHETVPGVLLAFAGGVALLGGLLVVAVALIPAAISFGALLSAMALLNDGPDGDLRRDPRIPELSRLSDALNAYDPVAVWLDELRLRAELGLLSDGDVDRVRQGTARVLQQRNRLAREIELHERLLAGRPLGEGIVYGMDDFSAIANVVEFKPVGLRASDGRRLAALEVA
jgi:hypothetical protein